MWNSLVRYGIRPQAGRNTALAALASDLPPIVLTELLDIGITTATRWANHARRDWAPYLAERRIQAPDGDERITDPPSTENPRYAAGVRTLHGSADDENMTCTWAIIAGCVSSR